MTLEKLEKYLIAEIDNLHARIDAVVAQFEERSDRIEARMDRFEQRMGRFERRLDDILVEMKRQNDTTERRLVTLEHNAGLMAA